MTTTPLTERTRASLPIRDYVIATLFMIGWAVYADRRWTALESSRAQQEKEIAAIQAGRTADNAKLDRVIETLSDVRTGVARIEERTRKP